MHCDMLKIQDGGAIVEKLNCKLGACLFISITLRENLIALNKFK